MRLLVPLAAVCALAAPCAEGAELRTPSYVVQIAENCPKAWWGAGMSAMWARTSGRGSPSHSTGAPSCGCARIASRRAAMRATGSRVARLNTALRMMGCFSSRVAPRCSSRSEGSGNRRQRSHLLRPERWHSVWASSSSPATRVQGPSCLPSPGGATRAGGSPVSASSSRTGTPRGRVRRRLRRRLYRTIREVGPGHPSHHRPKDKHAARQFRR